MKIIDSFIACALFATFLGCLWFATETTKTMTLVCMKVVGEQKGLQSALEACK